MEQANVNLETEASESTANNVEETKTQDNTQTEEKVFTQEQVTAIAAKASKTAVEKLLAQAGIAEEGDFKEKLETFKAWQESQMTEQEKYQNKIKDLEAQLAKGQSEYADAKLALDAYKYGIQPEYVEDAILLAKAKAVDGDYAAAFTAIVERNPHYTGKKEEAWGIPNTGVPELPEDNSGSTLDKIGSKLKKLI